MESIGYDRFTSSEPEITQHYDVEEPPQPPNRQNRRIFIMFGVLSVFLLILTFTVGIKFTQVGQQVSDLMTSLQEVSMSIHSPHQASAVYAEPTAIVRGPCEEDWVFYKEKCYFVSTLKKNWEDAEKNCVQQRAHLMVVNDREELDFITQVIKIRVHESFWIGLVERETEGSWSWVDGTDFSKTEHFWDEGQPDDWDVRVNGEDCGQLHANPITDRRVWNDADCTLPYKYICEGSPRRPH